MTDYYKSITLNQLYELTTPDQIPCLQLYYAWKAITNEKLYKNNSDLKKFIWDSAQKDVDTWNRTKGKKICLEFTKPKSYMEYTPLELIELQELPIPFSLELYNIWNELRQKKFD